MRQRHLLQDAATLSSFPEHYLEFSTPSSTSRTDSAVGFLHFSGSHYIPVSLNHKEKSVSWSKGTGCLCHLCQTGPALPRGNAHSRTALPNTSSCLRQQLSKASQEKIHLGVADPSLPQTMCFLRLCAFMPVSYGMWPGQFLWLGWPLQKTIFYRKLIHSLVTCNVLLAE